MTILQLPVIFRAMSAIVSLIFISSGSYAANSAGALGAFSPTNYKTQYVYDDKVIAGDRLQQVINKRKAEVNGCAAVLNGERGEYSGYYKVPGGFVAIEINLDQSGKVNSTRIAQNTLPDPKVADCVLRQVKELRVDVSGFKDFQLKKYLVLDIKCDSNKASDKTVQDRCSGSSQLYDKFSVQ